ncbi:MAG TPA: hypothetical protein VL992_17835, partial [Tepidisphaeraceae bacterium]|nr:hypothetical protein [Tepidisphaeraceae bacterium]
NPGAYPAGDGTGPMGMAKADEIDELFGADYAATLLTGQVGEDNREAMQLAIWNIVYDTDTTVNSGSFYVVSGVDANAISTANTWLANAANPQNQVYDANDVVALLGANGAQDQLAVIPCPLPPAAWGGGILLAGVAAMRIRRSMTQTHTA